MDQVGGPMYRAADVLQHWWCLSASNIPSVVARGSNRLVGDDVCVGAFQNKEHCHHAASPFRREGNRKHSH